jgi:putative peptidoglycan lipid II flippase
VAAGILVSRFGGLLREIVLAATLGTGVAADAFRAALRIPQLLQNLLGEGALSAAFIPVYSRLLEDGREKDAGRVAGAIAGLIGALTAALVLLGALLAPLLTSLVAPGFSGARYDLTVELTRIMTAGIGFVVLAAWCLGVLNAHRRFFLSYAAPLLWNLAQVAGVLLAAAIVGTETSIARWAAWGVLVGGLLQFLVQVPAVRRVAPDIRLSFGTSLPEVRQVLRRFGPAALGRGVVQVAAYLDLVLASLLTVGAVSTLEFAQILYVLPISLFAISVAAAELPEMSRTPVDGDLLERLRVATSRVSFLLVGCTVAYVLGGGVLVRSLYQRGEFDSGDTLLVWLTLAAYSIGMVAVGASRLIQNALFARGDTRGPAWIAVARVAIAGGLGLVLMFQLEQVVVDPDDVAAATPVEVVGDGALEVDGDLPAPLEPVEDDASDEGLDPLRLGTVGLALGSGIAAWFELLLLRRLLRRRVGGTPGVGRILARLLPAAAASAVVAVAAAWFARSFPPLVEAVVVLGLAGLWYVGVALVTGITEARDLTGRILRR